jgi:hypothetical protein
MTDYGNDIACLDDVAEDFRTVTGAALLAQVAYHRITTENLVDEEGWGIDITEEVGRAVTQGDLDLLGLRCADVVQRDPRIERVTCILTQTDGAVGDDRDVSLRLSGFGVVDGAPFELVIPSIADLTAEALRGGPDT